MGYSFTERYFAKLLDSFPSIRSFAKSKYHRLNFFLFGDRSFKYILNPKVSILYPSIGDDYKGCLESFFGYYDKTPWARTSDYYLYHEVKSNDKDLNLILWNPRSQAQKLFSRTNTWNFQQGAMLQWVNWQETERIIFNSCQNSILGSSIFDIESSNIEFCPWPVQTIHPILPRFISLNYLRLNRLRPEYGYNLRVKNFNENFSDDEDGLWLLDWSGKTLWFLSLERLKLFDPRYEMENSAHKVNHAIYSPNGKRIVFMHRWLGRFGKFSRLYVIDDDGSNLKLLLDNRMVSHYNWKSDDELVAWARDEFGSDHYISVNVITGEQKILGKGLFDAFGDGHPSFSPCGRFLLTDTYPDRKRQRCLLLFDLVNPRVTVLGRFFEPLSFEGYNRCDLHPRWSRGGSEISIDSCFSGQRSTYILSLPDNLDELFEVMV
jgi:hypothetical protein